MIVRADRDVPSPGPGVGTFDAFRVRVGPTAMPPALASAIVSGRVMRDTLPGTIATLAGPK